MLHRYISVWGCDRGREKAADCWRGICLLSKHGEIPSKDLITTEHNEIKHKTSQHNRGLTPLPGLVQPLVLPEHVEDQQGQGLLHGRQAHHHARGGGEKQRDHLQSIRINIDFEMPTSVKRSQSIQISRWRTATACTTSQLWRRRELRRFKKDSSPPHLPGDDSRLQRWYLSLPSLPAAV